MEVEIALLLHTRLENNSNRIVNGFERIVNNTQNLVCM